MNSTLCDRCTIISYRRVFASTFAMALALVICGCGDSGHAGRSRDTQRTAEAARASAQWRDSLFDYAVNNLNRIEEFEADEVRAQIFARIRSLTQMGRVSQDRQIDPLMATWPEPDMLGKIVNRLNQWIGTQTAEPDWKLDPLVATLPAPLREIPMMRNLSKMQFSSYDGFTLLETVWLRDISNWVRGKTADELEQTRNLFDWTICNIQLEQDWSNRIPLVPWETVLLGRGTAMERAWVFVLLLRQQGIDAAVLALPDGAEQGLESEPANLHPWCVAVLIGQKEHEKLYLFDPSLGVPIPAPQGIRIAGSGRLEIQPATLEQVVADRSLLDRLGDPAHPYWPRSADFKHLVVLVEASPIYLAKRTRLMESRLTGAEKMVLSTAATEQAAHLKQVAHVQTVGLWMLPYKTLHRRLQVGVDGMCRRLVALLPLYAASSTPLYRGRVLHLKGRFLDQRGAIECYQAARPSQHELGQIREKHLAEYRKNYEAYLERLPPEEQKRAKQWEKESVEMAVNSEMDSYVFGKMDASYWLGLIAFAQGDYASAADYFEKRTLEATPRGPWTPGAHYNLARCRESMGQPQEAIAEYQAGIFASTDFGNLVRARWLKELTSAAEKKAKKTPESDKVKQPVKESVKQPKAEHQPAGHDPNAKS